MLDVAKLHCSKTFDIFNTTKRTILNKWKSMRGLSEFFAYFNKQWLNGDFVNWQIYNTPPGYATTNGPIEAYNNTIKKFFTMRKKYNMLPALEILVEQMKFESIRERVFHNEVLPPQKLINEARTLVNNENGLQVLKHAVNCFKYYAGSKHFNIELNDDCKCAECCFCSCSHFVDRAYCTHILVACLHSKISFPGLLVKRAFKQKKKTGRPTQASKALLF
jgi:hypothetical protein